MLTVDRISIRAPIDRVFTAASDVERWPAILPHYRSVRFLERRADGGTVEMAAWRSFGGSEGGGPLRWPAWWVSEMTVDPPHREIRYRHVRGITQGMDVIWRLRGTEGIEAQRHGGTVGTVEVEIVHSWDGPGWPLIGRAAAALVIGPVFVHGIAVRTLAGIKRFAEGAE